MYFCQKSSHSADPVDPPPFHSVLLQLQTTRGWEKSCWAVVHSLAWHQSGFQSVSGLWLHLVGGVTVLSLARSFALSKWTAGVAPFWANSQNRSVLLHAKQILGEVSLGLVNARSKTERTLVLYLTVLLDPGSIRG
jgi:hypothetical protein